jgi:hypothetical protein
MKHKKSNNKKYHIYNKNQPAKNQPNNHQKNPPKAAAVKKQDYNHYKQTNISEYVT